ncbi:fused (3R)-hydroxyacyl-ACP dehydratase subunits HadA/HadB [Nocardia sp. NPDC058058]|uniref:fused (3R)-hydroxyacyl-ACP dehydratase subunits HadA/HadB n=1 Tax=Nocardia sp. NPDC058058 TaxID=3346317 RepID=UPI0036DF8FAC
MEVVAVLDPVAHALSVVGRRYRVADHYEVGREKVREYARAVQDAHPVHRVESVAAEYGYPGLVASPTFGALLVGAVQDALGEILTGYDLSSTMQTDQTFDYLRPIVVGDRLTSNVSLHSFRQAFGGDLLVVENIVTNQHEQVVLTARTGLIARSAPSESNAGIVESLSKIMRQPTPRTRVVTLAPELAEPSRTPVPPNIRTRAARSVTEGDRLPDRVVDLTLGDLVNYAGVAGDTNPIHWHGAAARLVGLDGTVAHGMLTMALAAGFVTDWVGDPAALRQYSVRMTSPVPVTADGPSTIEFQGRVKQFDPGTDQAVIALTATHAGRKIFGRATATVQLSDQPE